MSTLGTAPEISVRLYGEARPATLERRISVGALSFTLQGMALRWIRHHGIELLRGIAFVVRDADWGTYAPEVGVEEDTSDDGHCRLVLAAAIEADTGRLTCSIVVEASEAELLVSAEATAAGNFRTNRTGFVVLHPASCAGQAARVERADGGLTDGRFPELISPHQPFLSIRMLEHGPASGLTVQTRCEGEVFEMEDQRNWSDASFKTYSRPLALPFPYVIQDGETVRQSVRVRITGGTGERRSGANDPVQVRLSDGVAGRLPILGIGGRPQDYAGAALARLAALPLLLLAELDAPEAEPAIDAVRAAQEATGADLAVMVRRQGDGLAALARSGLAPQAVALVGADAALANEARRLFPAARIGTGTDAFFTEFNRQPPVPADFVFWTVNPTVHAEDDASVMETLSVLADQAATARALCPGAPLWCGPVTLRMRFNPNATGPAVAPPAGMPPPDVDARQRGLFGGAFTLGQIAAWATAGIDTLILHAPFGPRGLIHAPAGFPVPWYDEQADGVVYPAYQVLAGLASCSGMTLRRLQNSAPERVAALAVGDVLWLANLTPDLVTVHVPGECARSLDVESFVAGTLEPERFWNRDARRIEKGVVRLTAYAVARVT